MSFYKSTLVATLVAAASAAPAFAAVVGELQSGSDGDVVVQRAGEYYSAPITARLADGDCLTASQAATVRLENGCAFDLAPNQSILINAGATSCPASFETSDVCVAPDFASQDLALGTVPLVLGLGAIIAIGAIAFDGDDDEPASP